jgi:hypothetical protein
MTPPPDVSNNEVAAHHGEIPNSGGFQTGPLFALCRLPQKRGQRPRKRERLRLLLRFFSLELPPSFIGARRPCIGGQSELEDLSLLETAQFVVAALGRFLMAIVPSTMPYGVAAAG